MPKRFRAVALTFLFLFLAFPASAVSLTIVDGEVFAQVSGVSETPIPISVAPSEDSITVSRGANSSTTAFVVSNRSITISADHVRGATLGDEASSRGGAFFSVSGPGGERVPYILTAAYEAEDEGEEPGRVYMSVSMWDLATDQVIFSALYTSFDTVDEILGFGVPGTSGGDLSTQGHSPGPGNPALGELFSGRTYSISVTFVSGNNSGPADAATATGFVRISFVPEPSTGLLAGAGVLLLGLGRQVRRLRAQCGAGHLR